MVTSQPEHHISEQLTYVKRTLLLSVSNHEDCVGQLNVLNAKLLHHHPFELVPSDELRRVCLESCCVLELGYRDRLVNLLFQTIPQLLEVLKRKAVFEL